MNTDRKPFSLTALAVLFFMLLSSCSTSEINQKEDSKIIFPRPFAFAIDDLGWNTGSDDGDVNGQGPYRIGVDRKMDIEDYKCIVEVAKEVGVRVQGLFILSEMDRENILGEFPSTTWMGENWDNSKNISNEQIEIMNFVKENAAYLEFGLHGVGHEYWIDGKKNRAEWYSTDDNHPWPEESIREHIQCFKDIMGQYGLTPENGQSFPESFVPCAYSFYWNPEGDYSTGSLLGEMGVKYANTLFTYIPELNPPTEPNGGGFDHGVLVVNRINYGNDWYKLDALPTVELAKQESDIIESHWSNWLAQDNFLQTAVNEKWVNYYRMVQADRDRYVAKNTEQFSSQWLYNKYTNVRETEAGVVKIDNTNMPADAYEYGILGNMVLKVKLDEGQHLSEASLDGSPVGCYFEEAGYGFLYLPKLEKQSYELTYSLGTTMPDSYIFNRETYNVYDYKKEDNGVSATLRIYGTQVIDFYGIDEPASLELSSEDVHIVSREYDNSAKHLALKVEGVDIQGETFTIHLTY